jgi:hypothetical protein
MEIRDFVRANRQRLRLLVVLPVLAGVLALAALWGQPEQHLASVEVMVLPEGNDPLSPNAIGQYVANFAEAANSKPVKDAVIAATGVERTDLNDVEIRQVARSNVIEVSYMGPKRALAKEVVVASAEETVLAVAQPQLDALAAARRRHDEAAETHAADVAAIDAFRAETGLVLPEEEYQSRAAQLRILQDNRQEALASGGSISAAALEKVIEVRQVELDALGEQVMRFQELEKRLSVSTEELDTAVAELRLAEAKAERASIALDLSQAEATTISRTARIVKGVAVAAGLALVSGAALMLALELLRARSGSSPSPGEVPRWFDWPLPLPSPALRDPGQGPAPPRALAPVPSLDRGPDFVIPLDETYEDAVDDDDEIAVLVTPASALSPPPPPPPPAFPPVALPSATGDGPASPGDLPGQESDLYRQLAAAALAERTEATRVNGATSEATNGDDPGAAPRTSSGLAIVEVALNDLLDRRSAGAVVSEESQDDKV